MKHNIQALFCLALSFVLAGCQEYINLQEPGATVVPKGEMAFCIGTKDIDGAPLTKGVVSGEEYTSVASLQLICFDHSGYYLGLRTAYPTPDSGSQPKTGTFSGYVPESTARIHFIANVNLDLSDIAVGTSEKVIMGSEALSTKYSDIDQSDASAPKLCFWGYHKEDDAGDMKTWLQASSPNSVALLRDRARIKLAVGAALYSGGGWLAGSAGSGKKVTSIKWAVNNGRERGYLSTTPWVGYESGSINMNEYEDCGRYSLSEADLDAFVPSGDNFQYVYDDSNTKSSSENGRITIVLEVNYEDNGGGNAGTKYLLAQLREGSGANEGEMVQVVRNSTYEVNITNLAHDGYATLDQAVNPNADDFTNAPADVDITVPYITDGKHILNLLSPKPVVVTRSAGQVYNVEFEFKKTSSEDAPAAGDFKIYWEDNINIDWNIGSLTISSTTNPDVFRGTFTVTIGTIGSSYAYSDRLVIRHKKSGLSRFIHFYAVEQFLYRMNPTLEQVMVDDKTPYLGPSGDDTARPVFKLSFKLSQSLQEDLFPITVRIASSTLEPFGDKYTSHTARLSGGFSVLNASTANSSDGTALASSSAVNDWNYHSNLWNYWFGYTLQEYPKTGNDQDGEVVIYLKDIRDAYAQASNQSVGLYLDVENFGPVGLSIASTSVKYPTYTYNESNVAGVYKVGNIANKYRASITKCTPNATYTLSEESSADWLNESSTSITADASGRLDFVFSVTANTNVERSENIIFTNGSNSTKVTIIQASGMDSGIRLKAENTSVSGNTKEVKITVYSDTNWTLSSTGEGRFSVSSGSPTGTGGYPVKFIMPVNYTTDDIDYTVTATKEGSADNASVVITQRGYASTSTGTMSFTPSHYRTGTNVVHSNGNVAATFSRITQITGITLPISTYRMDVPDENTLKVASSIDSRRLMGVNIDYYVFGTASAPADTDVSNGSITRSSSDIDHWTGDTSEVTFTFHGHNSGEVVAIESFTVSYRDYVWK